MKLSAFKNKLNELAQINFVQANGELIPAHFHITEAGLITKHFIDCGGTNRLEKVINFQLWTADDTEHRLAPSKLLTIIRMAEPLFAGEDLEVEVEYQIETVGKYNIDFNGTDFTLIAKQTDCLAKENCRVPENKQKIELIALGNEATACTPGGGCC